MNARQLLPRALARRNPQAALGEAFVAKPPDDGLEPAGMLRVVVRRPMSQEALVGDETRGHASRSARSAAGSETGARHAKPSQT